MKEKRLTTMIIEYLSVKKTHEKKKNSDPYGIYVFCGPLSTN